MINEDNNNNLENKGYIFISKSIEDGHGEKFLRKAINISLNDDINDVTIYINSDGGNCNECWQIIHGINLMKKANKSIITIVSGEACSCAFEIFLTGDKRLISNKSSLMSHRFTTSNIRRKQPDMLENRKEQDWTHERFILHDMKCLNWTREKVLNVLLTPEDKWFTPQDAVDIGIATEIIE